MRKSVTRLFSGVAIGLPACLGLLGVTPAVASPLTYSFSDTLGSVDVNGTITTDGTIGVLAAGDIVAYQYTVTGAGAGLPVTVSCPLTCASVTVYGSYLTATATSLSFNYADPTTGLGAGTLDLYTGSPPALNGYLTWLATGAVAEEGGALSLNFASGPTSLSVQLASGSVSGAGDPVIASVSATPVPGALPLFATALGACGLLVWCMKRKERRCSRSRLIKTTNRISERPPHEAVFHFQAVDLLGRA